MIPPPPPKTHSRGNVNGESIDRHRIVRLHFDRDLEVSLGMFGVIQADHVDAGDLRHLRLDVAAAKDTAARIAATNIADMKLNRHGVSLPSKINAPRSPTR